jgi:hypothetical protein
VTRPRESGQAAVEAALTLPLTVFMVLGALQLFMLMQARIMAQYAAGRAAHSGSVNNANCFAMVKSAIGIVMPAIDSSWARGGTNNGGAYANAVIRHLNNKYLGASDGNRTGPIIWIDRVRPLRGTVNAATEEETWDLPVPQGPDRTLEIRMVFWAPLKVPFANWVFARMALATWGIEEYHAVDPLMPAKKDANWYAESPPPASKIATELLTRYDAQEYVFPVVVTYAMRMMSPPRFGSKQDCQ